VAIDEAGLAALRTWQLPDTVPERPFVPSTPPDTTTVVRRFLGMFLQCHLDLPMTARQAAFAWLETQQEAKHEFEINRAG
jgi:hypothetical protein